MTDSYFSQPAPEGGTRVEAPKESRTDPALRHRFHAEEQYAIDALAWWIGHPAVRPIIERRRVGAETVIMPIQRHRRRS